MVLHIVSKLLELLRRCTQCLGRVLTHRRHYVVIQILDELLRFFFQALRGFRNRLAELRRRFFTLVRNWHVEPLPA